MKATFFDGKNMNYDDNYPDPKPGEVLVRVNLAGICGTDLEILDGYMKYDGILGHEFVGTVEKSDNAELIGKRVVGEINVGCGICESCEKGMSRHCTNRTVLGILKRDGAFAEFLSLPEKNLHVIPDSQGDSKQFVSNRLVVFDRVERPAPFGPPVTVFVRRYFFAGHGVQPQLQRVTTQLPRPRRCNEWHWLRMPPRLH